MHAVRVISAEDVIAVRWPILRPGFARETAIFPGDEDPETRHFGAFAGGELVGVASIYRAAFLEMPDLKSWQLRGMATLEAVRGKGHGVALLAAAEEYARRENGALVWCNARVTAAEFYRRHGWQISGGTFDIPTVGPHFRMFRLL
jgi:GNAT superfamily N-acetyltransferase